MSESVGTKLAELMQFICRSGMTADEDRFCEVRLSWNSRRGWVTFSVPESAEKFAACITRTSPRMAARRACAVQGPGVSWGPAEIAFEPQTRID